MIMLSLDDREWKEFAFSEIFLIEKGFYNKKPNEDVNGDIPFLGATEFNNGITSFHCESDVAHASKTGVEKTDTLDNKIFSGNCICVTNNGSVGHAFYQKTKFTCSHDINPLYLKKHYLNEYLAKFIIACIEQQGVCFEYSRKWRPSRMVKSRIMLPINDNGQPDYEYMEQYIKERENNKLDRYISYCKSKLSELGDIIEVVPLEDKIYKDFFISDIFDTPKRGKRIVARNHVDGDIPLVSSIANNNGVSNFIGNRQGVQLYRNCLSIANGGVSAGKCFYEPFEFVASDHVTHCKNENLTSYQYFALSVFITKALFGNKYSFTREITDSRIKREKIILPINDNEEPDYAYMEQYVKNIMIKKYSQYLNYLMKKIS